MRPLWLGVLCAVLATGCGTVSSSTDGASAPSPARVTIAESEEQVAACTFVREVAVDPPLTLLTTSYPEMAFMTRDDVRKRLRREAAYAGGDTVLATEVEGGMMYGKAYECSG